MGSCNEDKTVMYSSDRASETAKAAYKYIVMHMNAYYCIIYKYLPLSRQILHATTLLNLAFSFPAALPCPSRTFSTIMNL